VAEGNDGGSGNSSASGQGNSGAGRSYSAEDVDRIVRDRLDRDRRKREEDARAADNAHRSDIDKLTASVQALTDRAAKAEAAVARRDVAEKYNLPKNIAAKLTGTAEDELDREAQDWVTQLGELGVPVKDGKIAGKQDSGQGGNGGGGTGGNTDGSDGKGGNAQGAGAGGGKDGGGQGPAGGDGAGAGNNGTGTGSGQQDSGGDAGKGRSLLGGRPTETLRSGAAPAGGGTNDVDAGKLADSILSRGI
jgi:hypothetical protein